MSNSSTKYDADRLRLGWWLSATLATVALLSLIWAGGTTVRSVALELDVAPLAPTAAAVDVLTAQQMTTLRAAATTQRTPRDTYADFSEDPSEEPQREPEPGTERSYYEAFLRELRGDPASCAARATEVLLGSGPDCEKVALLRAVYDTVSGERVALFSTAIATLPSESERGTESVPSFAVGFAAARAHGDPAARAILEAVTVDEGIALGLRRRAAASWAASASPLELRRLATQLAREGDAQLLDGAIEALSRNPHPQVAAEVSPVFTAGARRPGRASERGLARK
jgi:hypothetical protein